MPTAKLLKPRRLNYLGRIWEKGKVEPVDNHTAVILSRNERFKVEDLDPALVDVEGPELAPKEPEKPKGKAALGKAIREAIDQVDTENEANFGANGAPTAAAVSAVLGYDVTDDEIVLALNPAAKAAKPTDATAADLIKDKPAKSGGVKIVRGPKADAKPTEPAPTDGAGEPSVEV